MLPLVNLGDDLTELNWFWGITNVGTNTRPVTLQAVIKAKLIMRQGSLQEHLIALPPIYNETIDDLLRRMRVPLRAPSRQTHPE